MKKPKIKMTTVLLAFALFIIAAALFWSNRNIVVTLKREPAQITAMDVAVAYSGEMGEEPGPVAYSDTLDGEDFARLTAHTSFWRLPWAAKPGQSGPDLPNCALRIQCGEKEYNGWLSPDGKHLSINGENILVFGDLLEQVMALDLTEEPGGTADKGTALLPAPS